MTLSFCFFTKFWTHLCCTILNLLLYCLFIYGYMVIGGSTFQCPLSLSRLWAVSKSIFSAVQASEKSQNGKWKVELGKWKVELFCPKVSEKSNFLNFGKWKVELFYPKASEKSKSYPHFFWKSSKFTQKLWITFFALSIVDNFSSVSGCLIFFR